jgi:glycosyltransferase involved in cell wall biosynthesis
MKLLLVHNRYRYSGGEDQVFRRESELLRSAGHHVLEYTRDNAEITENGMLDKAKLGMRTLWAWDSREELGTILQKEKPQVVHFHNTFPLVSPAAYYACREAGVPIVQSLHNPRFMCPAATMYREGKVCQDCLGKSVPWPALAHSCYRHSFLHTAAAVGMLTFHRLLRTWEDCVDAYIVVTEFFRQKFITAGLPREKVFIKPHFLSIDPGMKQETGNYALFIGRLTPEKGIATLLKAWKTLGHIPLWIIGEGPMENDVRRFGQGNSAVRSLPRLSQRECLEVIKGARFLVWPSEGYNETFGLVAIEAFACGTTVITSGSGAMAEVVENNKTGLHFEVGDPKDLASKVEWAWAHPKDLEIMGDAAREEYKAKYTAERNYQLLMQIYSQARSARTWKAA